MSASPSPTTGGPNAVPNAGLEALQLALAAEHAAVYGWGVVGALAGPRAPEARTAWDSHRANRDRLAELVRDAGGEPVGSAPAYTLPFEVSEATASTLAVVLEEGVAAAYADLVAAAEDELRTLAATALQEAAVRAAAWRGSGVPFPGLRERD